MAMWLIHGPVPTIPCTSPFSFHPISSQFPTNRSVSPNWGFPEILPNHKVQKEFPWQTIHFGVNQSMEIHIYNVHFDGILSYFGIFYVEPRCLVPGSNLPMGLVTGHLGKDIASNRCCYTLQQKPLVRSKIFAFALEH